LWGCGDEMTEMLDGLQKTTMNDISIMSYIISHIIYYIYQGPYMISHIIFPIVSHTIANGHIHIEWLVFSPVCAQINLISTHQWSLFPPSHTHISYCKLYKRFSSQHISHVLSHIVSAVYPDFPCLAKSPRNPVLDVRVPGSTVVYNRNMRVSIADPQNDWFIGLSIMDNPIDLDDLGIPTF
jgi:hypothetical protein